jgi:hypothetical protein
VKMESEMMLAEDHAQLRALVLTALYLLVSINPHITTTSFA